ncbi:MAG: thermonuclease family protein [Burkholderiaceae bacterium]|nr:thermonuclease family protein [Burkholderiaceae bacterium]
MRAILLLTIALLGLPCQADLISGRVVSVSDVDTITVLDGNRVQHKIRLAGIDAPERTQAFGQRSRESLAELVANQAVIVETNKQDRYGRYVGKVLIDGQDVNVEQIRRGLAWFYRQYEQELSDSDRQRYDRAEIEARESRRGLWVDRRPVAPWDFRAAERRR